MDFWFILLLLFYFIYFNSLQISLSFYFLYALLGVSFLVGVGIVVILIPLNICVSVANRKHQARQLTLKDQRLKVMSEVLAGMKVRAREREE
jgi:hypothetical protein